MTSTQYSAVVKIQKLWRGHIFKKARYALAQERQITRIYGPQWGDYPSDSEFMYASEEKYEDPPEYYEHQEGLYCSMANSIMRDFAIKPSEIRDDDGVLLRIVFNSTKDTPTSWGTSLTINYEQSDEDDYDY